jgi:hypothetical protein
MTERRQQERPQNDSLSYRSYLFMLRIADFGASIILTPKEHLLKKLLQVQQELQLNELEITLFSIYLEKFGWNCTESIDAIFVFAAYTAKCFLNERGFAFATALQNKYQFFPDYQKWVSRFRSMLDVGYIELNYAYSRLNKADDASEEVDSVDYNLAVASLIETSTRPEKVDN